MSFLQEMTEPKVISATELRTKTRDILEEARFSGGQFIVETFGKPMVAIVGIEQYWEMRNRVAEPNEAETKDRLPA